MRISRVLAGGLGDQNMVIEDVAIETETTRGNTPTTLLAAVPRVQCPEDGVVVAHVPWARPGARHTWAFEDTCAWLAAHSALSVATVLLRVAWRTVATIVARVVANDLLSGLVRIGIDEIAYRKGHRYLTCVVDHTSGRLVWAAEGRNSETLGKFFDQLGAERAKLLTHVRCDGAEWIHALVRQRAPAAIICLDPFHVVAWALKALDKVRVRTMVTAGIRDRHAMWATRKNPPQLTGEQRSSLAEIAATNSALYRAYLLKEQLREVFRVKGATGRQLLAGWLSWASHSRIPEFFALARSVRRYRDLIWNTLDHGLSNARSEATNTHLRALTKRAYGFHSPDALIAMALLTRGGLCPPLPGSAA
ncbi:ISL3 family transposase [Mycobacterium kansasii]